MAERKLGISPAWEPPLPEPAVKQNLAKCLLLQIVLPPYSRASNWGAECCRRLPGCQPSCGCGSWGSRVRGYGVEGPIWSTGEGSASGPAVGEANKPSLPFLLLCPHVPSHLSHQHPVPLAPIMGRGSFHDKHYRGHLRGHEGHCLLRQFVGIG